MARTKQMKALEEMIQEKRAELRRLQIEIETLEALSRRTKGEELSTTRARAPRSNVKSLVLELLDEVKEKGLNAPIAVEMAEKRGMRLERGTVSSLLSKLKNEQTVTRDGNLYRLAQYRNDPNAGNDALTATVFPHPASRAYQ